MAFKIIVILCAISVLLRAVQQYRLQHISRYWALLWSSMWFGILGAALFPHWLDRAAQSLGVSRGADLLVYVAVIMLAFLVRRLLIRQQKMSEEITELVRAIALDRERRG